MSLSTAAPPADYEYVPVRIPPGTARVTAAVQLSLHAEYGGWELSTVRLHADGTRKVTLRRRRTTGRVAHPPPARKQPRDPAPKPTDTRDGRGDAADAGRDAHRHVLVFRGRRRG